MSRPIESEANPPWNSEKREISSNVHAKDAATEMTVAVATAWVVCTAHGRCAACVRVVCMVHEQNCGKRVCEDGLHAKRKEIAKICCTRAHIVNPIGLDESNKREQDPLRLRACNRNIKQNVDALCKHMGKTMGGREEQN